MPSLDDGDMAKWYPEDGLISFGDYQRMMPAFEYISFQDYGLLPKNKSPANDGEEQSVSTQQMLEQLEKQEWQYAPPIMQDEIEKLWETGPISISSLMVSPDQRFYLDGLVGDIDDESTQTGVIQVSGSVAFDQIKQESYHSTADKEDVAMEGGNEDDIGSMDDDDRMEEDFASDRVEDDLLSSDDNDSILFN
ncbi:hypothetical protein EC973_005234 [Apophysomyces ossiformis]|uniref:Uncharacterized protein n=1 Tax=Apophysomyces ossiformis TaxID=679940 RepID=A0A8H7BY16_9FUNG|nr:hypothetical protein EC973_005234 [Apophysomyces ossiformis]